MPHRVNKKGDIGTAKSHSDSYDAHNIYLTEEGWVYRHYKTADKTMWWDEILVAGQVKPGMNVHGVSNSAVTLTNPMKLGSNPSPEKFEDGSGNADFRYSDHVDGDAILPKIVVDVDDKTHTPGDLYKLQDAVKAVATDGTPPGWTGPSDPSMDGENPPFVGDDYQSCNEYNISVTPLPTPGRDTDPRSVVEGVPDGTCDSVTLTDVSISPASATVGAVLTATGGQPTAPTDGETPPPATVTYTWAIPGGTSATGATIVTSVAGTYTVTASVEGGSKTSPGVTVEAAPTPPALSVGEPTITSWTQFKATPSADEQTFTAEVTEAENSVSEFTATPNATAATIYTGTNTATATVTYAAPTLTVVVNNPDSDIYSINAAPFDIAGTAKSTEDGNTDEIEFTVSPVVVTSDDLQGVSIATNTVPDVATAATVTQYSVELSNAAKAMPNSRLEVFVTPDGSGDYSESISDSPAQDYVWTTATNPPIGGDWVDRRYEFSGTYKKFEGGFVNDTIYSVDVPMTLASSLTPATPVTVEGYYPLYTTESDSNADSGGNGTSHSHTLSGTTYYMPNGLTLGSTMWHGDYNNYGGSSGY